MPHDCGSTRRLQALTAIGWDTDTLATELGWTTSQLHRALSAGQTPPHTRHHITALYDLLSMTPGPSTTARQHAQQHGLYAGSRYLHHAVVLQGHLGDRMSIW
jgi:hypothetical protein